MLACLREMDRWSDVRAVRDIWFAKAEHSESELFSRVVVLPVIQAHVVRGTCPLSDEELRVWNGFRLCSWVLGYYCALVRDIGLVNLPTGFAALDPVRLFTLLESMRVSLLRGTASSYAFSYDCLGQFVAELDEVPLELGLWSDSRAVRKSASVSLKRWSASSFRLETALDVIEQSRDDPVSSAIGLLSCDLEQFSLG